MIRSLPTLACALLLATGTTSFAQSLINVHVATGGAAANFGADNDAPCMSEDNRYVTFASSATNLVGGDTNGREDVFVHDTLTGATILISADIAGGPSNGSSRRPGLSETGRYVVFQSDASDLVAGDANGTVDVFRYDRDADGNGLFDEPGGTAMVLVSLDSAAGPSNGASRFYSHGVSDDGDVIAFESDATDLIASGDTNGRTDCYVRIVSTGTTIRASVSTAGAQATSDCQRPAVSGNGAVVVFESPASELVGGDTNGASDVFVRDIAGGVTTRASLTASGAQSASGGLSATVSDDGTLVAFESSATDLVAGDTNSSTDCFVRDLVAGTTTRVSVSTSGAEGTGASYAASLAGGGSAVAFMSSATLVTGYPFFAAQAYVHDLAAGTTLVASRSASGSPANAYTSDPVASDDGTVVTFRSFADNLLGPGGDTNGDADIFASGGPFLADGPPPPPPPCGAGGVVMVPANPVTFSVRGPVDTNTEGILFPRGGPGVPSVIPGNPYAFGVRTGTVPQATGIATIRPGDVFDYDAAGIPSEGVLFESQPPPFPGAPDGTNNVIVETAGAGLISGLDPGMPMWATAPPMAPGRDNIDAVSFGEDYFPMMVMTGLSTEYPMLPDPPMMMGEPAATATPWGARVGTYKEPIVTFDGMGARFDFSVDSWALGRCLTAVAAQSLGSDTGAGLGPWTSGGTAAGDVFTTPVIARAAGVTTGGDANFEMDDNPTIALAPAAGALSPNEDDLDALEREGASTNWMTGAALTPGDVHERVMHVLGAGLPPAGASWHDPVAATPVFFSVTRNSPGAAFSAVRTQFLTGGAASDIYVLAKDPAFPGPGIGSNLLFLDNLELGLMPTDNLDAVIIRVCPEYRMSVVTAINEIMGLVPPYVKGGFDPWMMYGPSAWTGGGMTTSITKYLAGTGRYPPPGCIKVGFSVTTESVGLNYTAVDWETGPVFPAPAAGGVSSAAGDIFYAVVDGSAVNSNYLWHEAESLGLDPGTYVAGGSGPDFGALTDNIDGLDSDSLAARPMNETGVGDADGVTVRGLALAPSVPNPFRSSTAISYSLARPVHVRLTVQDVSGATVAVLADGMQASGPHRMEWKAGASPAGIYFLRLEGGGEVRTQRLVRTK